MDPTATPAPDDWNQHWDAYADAAALNPAQSYRRKLIFERLGLSDAAEARVLELGSGQGDLSRDIATHFPKVDLLGLDISHSGLAIAQQKVPRGTFIQQDFMQPFAVPDRYQRWATHAVCSEVLEHVADPREVLLNARRCLAPGARFVITVPAGPRSAFDRHIGHRRHFTPGGLSAMLRSAGLEVESVHGAGFPFFNLYRLAVVARGDKLIDDATKKGPLPLTARVTIRAFSFLFELNSGVTPWGWQLVAVAREPSARAENGGKEAA
jgi:SAM-dependent methyltransferase